jgi:hypothetical protein
MLLGDFLSAFHKGKMLANSAIWKRRAVAADVLAGLITSLVAIAAAFGYRIELEEGAVQALAGGIAAAVYVSSAVLHIVTTEKIGLPSRSSSESGGGDAGPSDLGNNMGGA